MRTLSFVGMAALGSLITGCDQPATNATAQRPATTNSYKLMGNRSADPLGNYSTDTGGTGLSPDASSVAQHQGSSGFPTTNSVRGGR